MNVSLPPSGDGHSLTSTPSDPSSQPDSISSRSNFFSIDFGVPTRYFAPRLLINSKFSSLTIPRSITHTLSACPYFPSITLTISSTVVTSVRLPSNTSKARGNPSRLATIPIQTCKQSGRLSRLYPLLAWLHPLTSPSKYVEVIS